MGNVYDDEVMTYNDQMRNESDRMSEYLEMRNMYKEGLLEA
jgi:hypothetical protein